MEMIALLNPEEKQDSLLITIPLHELEEKVQQVGVSNVLPFLDSDLFKENKFSFAHNICHFIYIRKNWIL